MASTDLNHYLDWPGLAQVWRWERTWQERDARTPEVRYGITSLPSTEAPAPRFLELKRDHWIIENGLRYVKDVTMGEDRSLIHQGTGPNVMSVLHNTDITALRWVGETRIARTLRPLGR